MFNVDATNREIGRSNTGRPSTSDLDTGLFSLNFFFAEFRIEIISCGSVFTDMLSSICLKKHGALNMAHYSAYTCQWAISVGLNYIKNHIKK